MFGLINANWKELDDAQKERYSSAYCGICRSIHKRIGNSARIVLNYDMVFLALIHMSLYEPEEQSGKERCFMHPLRRRAWIANQYVDYSADMNVALAYYKAMDDISDERKASARLLAKILLPYQSEIHERYPRQCEFIAACIRELSAYEQANTDNPDLPASRFGELMAELMTLKEDRWCEDLRQIGFSLGRFIYLADAMLDYDRDRRKGQYNPLLFREKNEKEWEEYLVMEMARCTESYERLPLVQDKPLLDNILYSGVWIQYRRKNRKEASDNG